MNNLIPMDNECMIYDLYTQKLEKKYLNEKPSPFNSPSSEIYGYQVQKYSSPKKVRDEIVVVIMVVGN